MILQTWRRLSVAAFVLAAVNFLMVTALGRYDVRFGPLHLAATYLFKPLLYLNAAFLLVLALRARSDEFSEPPGEAAVFRPPPMFWLACILLVLLVYGISFRINLDFSDWTHRSLTTHATPWDFFTHRQTDGFYRPLTFFSLWIDNRIFGSALWGYHVQSLLLHFLNGVLVARLAFRLRFDQALAAWAGVAFLAVPASFEAVIWPGARFDLLGAAFTFFALERAIAGSLWFSTAAYCLGVLSKETAYAYPLLIGALFIFRRPLALLLPREKWIRLMAATAAATIVLLLIRIAVYGNLGGYPNLEHTGNVNFVLTWKTFTGIFTRLPAALFLVNSGAGLPVWLRLTLVGHVALLSLLVFQGATAGRRTLLLVFPFLAVMPMLNMFGWMTPFAQQGRYLYHPVIWIVFVLVAAIRSVRFSASLLAFWILILAAGALFNTLAYVKMIRTARLAAADAAAACSRARCRTLWLRDVPHDLYGAFYFEYQVVHDLQRALPGVSMVSSHGSSDAASPECGLQLRWTARNRWSEPASMARGCDRQ